MGRNKIALFLNTIKYLKFKQIYFRIFYFFKKKFFKFKFQCNSTIETANLKWKNTVYYNNTYFKKNKFSFLNLDHKFNQKIDWNYRTNGLLWCYNLNYFEYLNQKDLSFSEGISLIKSYVENDNFIDTGKDSYPISLRGINWIKFILIHEIKDTKINLTLFKHYKILFRNIEYHIMGNHILENGFSLFFAAYFFKNQNFLTKSKKILFKELNEQILNDGSHFELSTMYHQIILFRILDCISFLKINKIENKLFNNLFRKKAELMLSFLQTISYNCNTVPLLNDSSKGVAPESMELFKYAKSLNLKWTTIKLDESGYKKWIFDNFEIIMDVGKIGPDYIPGHAHADTFNFELYFKSKPVVIDLGISTYENNGTRINERSTKFHNTISVDNKNSSEVWSSFRVAERAKVKSILKTTDTIKFSHNGYIKLGLIHTRMFSKTKNIFKIEDHLGFEKNKNLCSNLHFHPDVKPRIEDNFIFISDLKIKMVGYINPKLIEYNYPLGFNKYKRATKLISLVNSSSSLEFLNNKNEN